MVDKSLFIASSPVLARVEENVYEATPPRQKDELTASPLHVESYPPKTLPAKSSIGLDTPARRQLEGVYDRYVATLSTLLGRFTDGSQVPHVHDRREA